jgi:hypothetical protein
MLKKIISQKSNKKTYSHQYGYTPKEIASALLRFAWCKNHTGAKALQDGAWMRGLQRISSTEKITQFINLWNLVNQVHLTEQPDDISWRFTKNG